MSSFSVQPQPSFQQPVPSLHLGFIFNDYKEHFASSVRSQRLLADILAKAQLTRVQEVVTENPKQKEVLKKS